MKPIVQSSFLFLMLFVTHTAHGQGPVIWNFHSAPVVANETTLRIKATIFPGWHLYSQRMKQGGPLPTRFTFDDGSDYIPFGVTEESGPVTVFYDDTYEMEVAWYTGTANFSQQFRLRKPNVTITGKIEYMTCNDHVCLPGEQKFRLATSP